MSIPYAAAKKQPANDLTKNLRGVKDGMDNDQIRSARTDLQRWRPSWVVKDQGSIENLTPMKLAFGLSQHGPLMFSGSYARFISKRWGHWSSFTASSWTMSTSPTPGMARTGTSRSAG